MSGSIEVLDLEKICADERISPEEYHETIRCLERAGELRIIYMDDDQAVIEPSSFMAELLSKEPV